MMDSKKVSGIIGTVVMAVGMALVTQWMTDREIENRVEEKFAEREESNS